MKLTFYYWLILQHKRSDDIGRLSREIRSPYMFEMFDEIPKGKAKYNQWKGYFLDNYYRKCNLTFRTFRQAWKEFLKDDKEYQE